MAVLTGVDILGIQSYVFASNRLRDVLSASWMVEHITSSAVLAQWGVLAGQILMNAGGNAILEFNSLDAAKTWTAHYTRWLHDTAPGLEVVVAHRVTEKQPLAWALKALQIDLARAKAERIPSAPQLGLSVTASCSVTGLPATDVDHGDLISPRIQRLRACHDDAKQRWDTFLPSSLLNAPSWSAAFPDELDRMGRTHGDTSTLGVVHVDGNNVGKMIAAWLDRCLESEFDDATVRGQYREWTQAIRGLGEAVLGAVVQRAASAIHATPEGGEPRVALRGTPEALSFDLRREGSSVLIPMRPVLLGGDDLTFVCDGRIALDLAAAALEAFARHRIPHLGQDGTQTTISACAGVALVKPHAPFHRSYALSEALCTSAKRERRVTNDRTGLDSGSWLDWHVGTTRPGESVERIRARQYQRGDRNLTMRPYPLTPNAQRRQTWRWLERDVLGPGVEANDSFRGFRSDLGPNAWSGSRSRVKLLGQLVGEDGDAVRRQLEAWRAIDGAVSLPGNLDDTGFVGQKTPLLDAIELLDLHLRLDPDPREADAIASGGDASQEGR
jgi:hypothetical protein